MATERLIEWKVFYAVSAIFQPHNGGDKTKNGRMEPRKGLQKALSTTNTISKYIIN